MRLIAILKFLPIFSQFLNAPWSNIRSIVYGIICYWVKPGLVNQKK